MHDTLNEYVRGYVDNFIKNENTILLKGWAFHNSYKVCQIRVKYQSENNEEKIIFNNILDSNNSRNDVMEFYNFTHNHSLLCGWNFKIVETNLKYVSNIEVQMFFDEIWNTIFTFEENNFNYIVKKVSGQIPSFVVVDNFYENVDTIRKFALSQNFNYHPDYHKGKRTDNVFLFEGLKESFENILNCKIHNWTQYGVNGCFQYCVGGDQLVYHVDKQEYAGIIFLTPDAPPESGTSFYRSKNTKKMKLQENDFELVFKNGFLDPTEFEVVDVVGNVYNRLVLFDSQMFHAASTYFGTKIENGRLFQLFFFDLEH